MVTDIQKVGRFYRLKRLTNIIQCIICMTDDTHYYYIFILNIIQLF